MLALAATLDLTLELMDVQTAYLNAPLKEKVYMAQPEGYEARGRNMVWLLQKAIYGSSRRDESGTNTRRIPAIASMGFNAVSATHACMWKRSRTGRIILVPVYVDDIPSAHHPG